MESAKPYPARRRTLWMSLPIATLLLACPAIAADANPQRDTAPDSDISLARAYWLAADTLAWDVPQDSAVLLYHSANATLSVGPQGLTGGVSIALQRNGVVNGVIAEKFRHLAGLPVYRIPVSELGNVPRILKAQYALAALDANGSLLDATGVQPAGVLDELYTFDGALGIVWNGNIPVVRVWAPTARSVKLLLFDDSDNATPPGRVLPMTADAATGTWRLTGDPDWNRKYYLYEVEVYARSAGDFVSNLVTDPYSVSLSTDSRRSQIVDLDDPDLKPRGWDSISKPALAASEDIVVYELHLRDFSMHDDTVDEAVKGTYRAFKSANSNGMKHLRRLADAGLSHVHLLPVFDCATIPEDRSRQASPGDLAGYPPNGTEQQTIIEGVRDRDGFNWCYDPYHYTTPEGSYSSNPDGPQRILEFREMVSALNDIGLRVVMDVVYNHTSGSLQGATSVLDRIVPDYYHRLDHLGRVETSSCCANTASEHAMMEKLMIDSLVTWATAYKVDGFRFDLMGHHSRSGIEKARKTLQSLTPADGGVDGKAIYLYGEGWNFGEVANDARFVQATQLNMGDNSGVGTFNDRLRDGVRGGGPFDTATEHIRRQGFINGLYYDPNAENSGAGAERDALLELADWIRTGLAGALAEFRFDDRHGRSVRSKDVAYAAHAGAGYTSDPEEAINYVAAHDNETLFDINQYKLPLDTSMDDRVRVQNLGSSIVLLSQGIPFIHAGQDMLRSKSLDRNSYDSGDWFNVLDFGYSINGWGRGLPPRSENAANWAEAGALLGRPEFGHIETGNILAAHNHLREMLLIRKSSELFRLRSAADVIDRLAFHNTGRGQVPGLIVMSLRGDERVEIVVLFNATTGEQSFRLDTGENAQFELHPILRESLDPVVREAAYDAGTSTFVVPARTTAVFVSGN